MKVALLGASTPFVVPLFAELALIGRLPQTAPLDEPAILKLHGRNEIALDRVRAHAQHVLPHWSVVGTTSLSEAVDGADVVVHQIRYGDLAGRAADEQLAAELGAPADETLGPGALQSALRGAPGLRSVIAELQRGCPDALVVNLTNPLSVTTALIAAAGLRVIGLCELPEVTGQTAAALVGMPITWSYTGLNHRGFLHHLALAGRPGSDADAIALVSARLGDRSRLGVLGSEVAALNALPLKYFGLFAAHEPHGAGRARALLRMRAAALEELALDPTVVPPSIGERSMPWWPVTVGPALAAICLDRRVETVLNLPEADGLVRERRAVLTGQQWQVIDDQPAPVEVQPWLARFEAHERAVLAALDDPSLERITAACVADPALPASAVERAARRLWA